MNCCSQLLQELWVAGRRLQDMLYKLLPHHHMHCALSSQQQYTNG